MMRTSRRTVTAGLAAGVLLTGWMTAPAWAADPGQPAQSIVGERLNDSELTGGSSATCNANGSGTVKTVSGQYAEAEGTGVYDGTWSGTGTAKLAKRAKGATESVATAADLSFAVTSSTTAGVRVVGTAALTAPTAVSGDNRGSCTGAQANDPYVTSTTVIDVNEDYTAYIAANGNLYQETGDLYATYIGIVGSSTTYNNYGINLRFNTSDAGPVYQMPLPTTAAMCRNAGWKTYHVFSDRADCVNYVAANA